MEILIHTSAPAAAQDDKKYRKQAQGFLAFLSSETRQTADRKYDDPPPHGANDFQQLIRAEQRNEIEKGAPPTPSRMQAQSPSLALPYTWSFAEESQQLPPTPAIDRARKLLSQDTPSPAILVGRTPGLPRATTAPLNSMIEKIPRLRRSQSHSWDTPPSIIPDSQPPYQILGKRDLEPFDTSANLPSSSPLAKRPRLEDLSSRTASYQNTLLTPSRQQVKSAGLHSSPRLPSSPPGSSSLDPAMEFSSIYAPPPPISCHAFETHVTPSLALLAANKSLSKHYRPVLRVRDCGNHERGYWELSIPVSGPGAWDLETRTKFWTYLTEFICKGQAGWNVWAEWLEELAVESGETTQSRSSHGITRGTRRARVWCWGETVSHIWYLLFIASNRKVKGCGARWIDAEGNIVVRM